jgi:hypothetical protein
MGNTDSGQYFTIGWCSEEGGAAAYGGADLSDIEAGGGCTVAIVNEAR